MSPPIPRRRFWRFACVMEKVRLSESPREPGICTIDIAKSIYAIKVRTPTTNQTITKVLCLTEKQQELAKLFNL